jgi:type IV secretory pathway VirB4 component
LGPDGFNDPACHFHQLTWKNIQINPLDWVGENRAEQEEQVTAMLQTMLKRPLDNIDKGFVSKALATVYEGLSEAELVDPDLTPRLELFCQALRDLKRQYYGDQAEYLAEEISGLYVTTGMGDIFNRPTNLRLNFDGADLYDAQSVAGQDSGDSNFQTLLYFVMFSSLVRTCRLDKQAGRARPRILAIDEYYAMSRNPFLSKRLEVLIKTARNLKLGLWLAEQNLATFSGTQIGGGGQDLTSHFMLTNIPFWIIFKQENAEADLARANFRRRLPPAYADFLPQARQGQGVALLDQTTLLNYSLLPTEAEFLLR